jgi:hypothetical protein
VVVLLALVVLWPPVITGGRRSVRPAASARLREFARRDAGWAALGRSLIVSCGVAAAAIRAARLPVRFRRFGRKARRLVALPVALPPWWGHRLPLPLGRVRRRHAPADGGARSRGGLALSGLGAILVVRAYSMYVYFYLFARAARFDGSLLEAASAPRAPAFLRSPCLC